MAKRTTNWARIAYITTIATITTIAALVVISIVHLLSSSPRRTRIEEGYENDEEPQPQKFLVVQAEWGMCNRLRTFNTCYELAKRCGRQMVIINDSTHYEKFWGGDWNKLIKAPVPIEPLAYMKGKKFEVFNGERREDCGMRLKLADLQANDKQYLVLRTCEVEVQDAHDLGKEFYSLIKPTEFVEKRIKNTMERIRSGYCVGVHIRQGNFSDYEQGYFFGKWENDVKDVPLMCCFDDKAKNLSQCPNNIAGIERFVEAMSKEKEDTKFFVCSDRPGCILWLEGRFPRRILFNPLYVEYEVNYVMGFCDWWCLAQCNKLLLSGPSSFSSEAAKINDLKAEYIDIRNDNK